MACASSFVLHYLVAQSLAFDYVELNLGICLVGEKTFGKWKEFKYLSWVPFIYFGQNKVWVFVAPFNCWGSVEKLKKKRNLDSRIEKLFNTPET